MARPETLAGKSYSVGEVAVDGLLYGLAAGVVMALFLIATRALAGDAPTSTLSRFGTDGAALPLVGALSHLATAAVYGIIGGIVLHTARRWPVPGWVLGAAYGLLLWALAEGLLLAALASPLSEIPALPLAAAHALYGLTLGLLFGRKTE